MKKISQTYNQKQQKEKHHLLELIFSNSIAGTTEGPTLHSLPLNFVVSLSGFWIFPFLEPDEPFSKLWADLAPGYIWLTVTGRKDPTLCPVSHYIQGCDTRLSETGHQAKRAPGLGGTWRKWSFYGIFMVLDVGFNFQLCTFLCHCQEFKSSINL